jgi:hypothetical protein
MIFTPENAQANRLSAFIYVAKLRGRIVEVRDQFPTAVSDRRWAANAIWTRHMQASGYKVYAGVLVGEHPIKFNLRSVVLAGKYPGELT